VAKRRLHPQAPRVVLKRLIRESAFKQKDVATAVGEREDTFSKILAGADSYNLESSLVVNVLNYIGVDFVDFALEVEKESALLYDAG